jgi:hypothetical protein
VCCPCHTAMAVTTRTLHSCTSHAASLIPAGAADSVVRLWDLRHSLTSCDAAAALATAAATPAHPGASRTPTAATHVTAAAAHITPSRLLFSPTAPPPPPRSTPRSAQAGRSRATPRQLTAAAHSSGSSRALACFTAHGDAPGPGVVALTLSPQGEAHLLLVCVCVCVCCVCVCVCVCVFGGAALCTRGNVQEPTGSALCCRTTMHGRGVVCSVCACTAIQQHTSTRTHPAHVHVRADVLR